MRTDPDAPPRARIPADVEAPDKLMYNLTARQVAILTVAAVLAYGCWRAVGPLLPVPVTVAGLIPIAGVAVVLALGRRDGLSLDAWFLAAVRHRRAPKRAVPAPEGHSPPPAWAPAAAADQGPTPSVLRLPAHAIAASGVIDLGNAGAACMVAATTVNIGLRTGEEQWALLDAYARWLNSLTGPVQVVVSAQRVDLSTHTARISDAAAAMPHPALADAAFDYADFLLDLAARRDPLWRTVTVVCAAAAGRGADTEALRRAEHTASALAALGGTTCVLDGAAVTGVLTAATDPYQYGDSSWPRARPDESVTTTERRPQ